MKEFSQQYKLPITCNHGMCFDKQGFHVLDIKNNALDGFLPALINGEDIDIHANLPVKYEPTKIIDAKGEHIISIRGWGRLSKLPNGAEIQDAIGQEIANLINH